MSNKQKLEDIRELCEEIKKVVYDNEYMALDPDGVGNLLEYVRIIKSMTHYIKDETPKIIAFERCDDGELFTLNDDGVTYSIQKSKQQFPDNLHMEYTAQHLINTDFFKPILK